MSYLDEEKKRMQILRDMYETGYKTASQGYIELFKAAGMDDAAAMITTGMMVREKLKNDTKDTKA